MGMKIAVTIEKRHVALFLVGVALLLGGFVYAYNSPGVPSTFGHSANEIEGLSAYVVPSGAVSFFNLASCPTGWSPMSDAQGRYIVGAPNGGTIGGIVGTSLSDLQAPLSSFVRITSSCIHCLSDWEIGYDFVKANAGVSNLNAAIPYIQLLVCVKD